MTKLRSFMLAAAVFAVSGVAAQAGDASGVWMRSDGKS